MEQYFRESGRTFRKSRFRLWFNQRIKTAILKAGFKALGIYGQGMRNATSVRVKEVVFRFQNLPPALDGFRILHLSDFHIDGVDGLAERLETMLSELHPDLCVFTGDYRFELLGPCDQIYPRMQRVVSAIRAKHGTLATLGNHDSAEIAYRLEEMGVRMLVNEAVEIKQNGSSLWVAGLDDQFDYRRADLPLALEDVPGNQERFVVLLAHDPQLYRIAAQSGIALYLCGHTHAGQIRLPLIGAAKKNAAAPRKFIQGQWRYRQMQGYTSWGLGCSTLPIRFNCPPEIALLELRRHV